MLNKQDAVDAILRSSFAPKAASGKAFAPINIALCKYWGKRNDELNLPVTSSLSISMGHLGTTTKVSIHDRDQVVLNGEEIDPSGSFARRLFEYLDRYRGDDDPHYLVETESNIPIAAGVASSASGFAALVLALNELYGWKLSTRDLSILARLGSGSASRSVASGFVEWHAGAREDGMDSYAEAWAETWPDLRIGLVTVSTTEKPVDSRTAMKRTMQTSPLYEGWPGRSAEDLDQLRTAIREKDFNLLGETAESNALAMHEIMFTANPPVNYWLPESKTAMDGVREARSAGIDVYFTMDAGPNVKMIFEERSLREVASIFPEAEIISPFG